MAAKPEPLIEPDNKDQVGEDDLSAQDGERIAAAERRMDAPAASIRLPRRRVGHLNDQSGPIDRPLDKA